MSFKSTFFSQEFEKEIRAIVRDEFKFGLSGKRKEISDFFNDDMLWPRDVAELLGKAISTIYSYAKKNKLKSYKYLGDVYFKKSEVLKDLNIEEFHN